MFGFAFAVGIGWFVDSRGDEFFANLSRRRKAGKQSRKNELTKADRVLEKLKGK
jgi:hypothetical protein